MGKYTVAGKNTMLNALAGTNPTAPITHGALFDAATPITGVTGTAADDTFSKTSHGLANGDLVILTELTGGAGLFAGDVGNANEAARPYFVVGALTNSFQLSETSGGSAVNFTTDVTALTVTELVEISGGAPAYARKAIAFSAAAGGTMDDSTNGAVFDVPSGATVDYVGYYSAVTAGTLNAVDKVTSETFGAQGTYTLTDADLDLLAA
jgi:hypothetical protein